MKPSALLKESRGFSFKRKDKYLICQLNEPHKVFSTCRVNGGYQTHLKHLINHQSCEGKDHQERYDILRLKTPQDYHHDICLELELDPQACSLMGTAANMQYAAFEEATFDEISVTAGVTAGVSGNAGCAGDPAHVHEKNGQFEQVINFSGTINTFLVFNHPLTDVALARAVMTMTEAKSAALEELAIRSRYSARPATGTGTDQFCIASPLRDDAPLTWTGNHTKIGEMIGQTVLAATKEALRWQNGLEISQTRGMLHVLKRFGLDENRWLKYLRKHTSNESDFNLLKGNSKAIHHDPHVGCCAYALAAILDRIHYGVFPESVGHEQIRNQCALLASNVSGHSHLFASYQAKLSSVSLSDPFEQLALAVALGWKDKWQDKQTQAMCSG